MQIFNSLVVPDTLSEDLKVRFSDELLKNVFRDAKRTSLCLGDSDFVKFAPGCRGIRDLPSEEIG